MPFADVLPFAYGTLLLLALLSFSACKCISPKSSEPHLWGQQHSKCSIFTVVVGVQAASTLGINTGEYTIALGPRTLGFSNLCFNVQSRPHLTEEGCGYPRGGQLSNVTNALGYISPIFDKNGVKITVNSFLRTPSLYWVNTNVSPYVFSELIPYHDGRVTPFEFGGEKFHFGRYPRVKRVDFTDGIEVGSVAMIGDSETTQPFGKYSGAIQHTLVPRAKIQEGLYFTPGDCGKQVCSPGTCDKGICVYNTCVLKRTKCIDRMVGTPNRLNGVVRLGDHCYSR